MKYTFWVSDLTTDEGEMVSLAGIEAAIEKILATGKSIHDVGICLNVPEDLDETEAPK